MRTFLIGLAVVIVASIFLIRRTSGFVVKTGNVGLVVNHYSGKIDPRVRTAGFNAQVPFSGNELIEIPTYQRTYTMVRDSGEGSHRGDDSVLVNTLSSNTLNVDASVTYHIAWDPQNPQRVVALYNKYRTQFRDFARFEEVQLRPAFRQAIVNAFGSASTSQNMTGAGKRAAAAYALKQLNERFNADSIVVDEVRVRAIYPDPATVTALRSRLQAQQNLKLSKLNYQLQQLVNQKSVLKAQADARAAQIRAASLTPRLIKFRHIPNIEIVGVPRGAIVNLPSPAGETSGPMETAPAAPQPPAPAETNDTAGQQ